MLNLELPYDQAIPLLGIYWKELKMDSNRYLYTNAHYSIIYDSQKEAITQMSTTTDEWINKMWYIHTMEYYSAIKRNEVLMHATAWRNH